jgi:hypothetical protein
LLFKLFRIEENLEKNAEEITTLADSIAGLREEKETHDSALDDARAVTGHSGIHRVAGPCRCLRVHGTFLQLLLFADDTRG